MAKDDYRNYRREDARGQCEDCIGLAGASTRHRDIPRNLKNPTPFHPPRRCVKCSWLMFHREMGISEAALQYAWFWAPKPTEWL